MRRHLFFSILLIMIIFSLAGCGTPKSVSDADLTVKMEGNKIKGSYSGELVGSKAEGQGVFVVTDENGTWTYEGGFSASGMQGEGTYTDKPVDIEFQKKTYNGQYSGAAKDGKLSGNGTFTYTNDEDKLRYEGEFEEGKIIGKGLLKTNLLVVHFSEVDRVGEYYGETLDGIPSGDGMFTATNDAGVTYTYDGQWKDGIFNGYGKRYFLNKEEDAEIGTYVKGEFEPTLPDIFETLGGDLTFQYAVHDKARQFLNEHTDLFPANSEAAVTPYVNFDLTSNRMSKSPKDYGDQMICVSGKVFQIYEFDCYDYPMTFINLSTAKGDVYTIYYPGKIDVYKDAKITVYGTPLDYASYENLGTGRTQTYILAGSFIK